MKIRSAVLLLSCVIAVSAFAQFPQGVAAGDVTSDSAVLWARSAVPGDVHFMLFERGAGPTKVQVAKVSVTDTAIPAKNVFTGLLPNRRYEYMVVAPHAPTERGTFVTPAAVGERYGLHFGVSGDWRGELRPYVSISNAPASNLDFWVSLGDTIYADFPTEAVPAQAVTLADFRAKHAEVYSARAGMNTLADLRRSTAIFATTDDHEVTDDFAGGAPSASDPRFAGTGGPLINDTTMFANGMRAFIEYNPIRDETYSSGKKKFYRYQSFGSDAAIFLLDARSFRDKELTPANPLSNADVGRFILQSFDIDPATFRPAPRRTMLGAAQLDDLKRDLIDAQSRGITWKLIMLPEPIQNLGIVFAQDRYEGYARERSELLGFIRSNNISNVLFITTDLHGVIVNNLTFQLGPGFPQIPTDAFEIIAGPVAFDPPLGPFVVPLGAALGLIDPATRAFYDSLPVAPDRDDAFNDKDDLLKGLWNGGLLLPFGYDLIGLAGSPINATLHAGDYFAVHEYGWSEFTVDRHSQQLDVTTWGIAPYSPAEAATSSILARRPVVISRFTVVPR